MSERPSILLIYCDELRADALGCYGHEYLDIRTPNLDRLAAAGTQFNHCYTNSPLCVPARVNSLTGLPCERTGVYGNEPCGGPFPHYEIPVELDTLPQVLERAGYATANFGKIHLPYGMWATDDPSRHVFQLHHPGGGGMNFWTDLSEDDVRMIRAPGGGMNGGVYPADRPYPPDAVARDTEAWIADQDGPWFARASILQPHTPVLPPAQFAEMYLDQVPVWQPRAPEEASLLEKRIAERHHLDKMDPADWRLCYAHYYAQVAWIDTQVGRLLDFLEMTGRLENTIIAFTSDHGNGLGERGYYEKHCFVPAVQQVPFILAWDGTLEAGRTVDGLTDALDLPRTLMDLAGVDAPEQFRQFGRALFSEPTKDEVYSTVGFGLEHTCYGGAPGKGRWYGGRGWPRRSCIRTARYRMDRSVKIEGEWIPADSEEADIWLSDGQADPREEHNVADDPSYADVLAELSAKLDAHCRNPVEPPPEQLVPTTDPGGKSPWGAGGIRK